MVLTYINQSNGILANLLSSPRAGTWAICLPQLVRELQSRFRTIRRWITGTYIIGVSAFSGSVNYRLRIFTSQ